MMTPGAVAHKAAQIVVGDKSRPRFLFLCQESRFAQRCGQFADEPDAFDDG